jgi:hypothetical protein
VFVSSLFLLLFSPSWLLQKYSPAMNFLHVCIGKNKKKGPSEIASLLELCIITIRDNIECLENIGDVPSELLVKLLDGCSPQQLDRIENYSTDSSDLSGVTEAIWRRHCYSYMGVKNDNELGGLTWRELYKQRAAEYEEKKRQTGKHLRSMYRSEEKEREAKRIKVLSTIPATPKARKASYGRGGSANTSAKTPMHSHMMEKCIKEMKKNPSLLSWKASSQRTSPSTVNFNTNNNRNRSGNSNNNNNTKTSAKTTTAAVGVSANKLSHNPPKVTNVQKPIETTRLFTPKMSVKGNNNVTSSVKPPKLFLEKKVNRSQ